jgi:predicted protein tyrosine phosphatase
MTTGGLQLIVGGASELRSHARGWATTLIAANLVAAGPSLTGRRLVLPFADTADARSARAFSPMMADVFVRFARATPDNPEQRVVVACQAGIGRSPALAFGLLCAVGRPVDQALETVLAARPKARPNPLVVQLLDARLGLRGAMVRELEAWRRTAYWWTVRPRRLSASFA